MRMKKARQEWLVLPLCLWILLMPALTPSAQAQRLPSPQLTQQLPPIGIGPAPAVFETFGTGLGVEAENGFVVSIANGEWRHEGHVHQGGSGSIRSPWGEEMPIRYWFNPDGSFAIEYDGNATMHYGLDEFGGLTNVTAVTEEGISTAFAGDLAQRAAVGGVDPRSIDLRPYEDLLRQIGRNHSEDFLSGTERLERKLASTRFGAPASCAADIISCSAAILGWIVSVPAIAAGCTAGGAITFGMACLAAILGHEAAGAAAVGSCLNAIQNCSDDDDEHGDPGGGCSGPGGTAK